MEFILLLISNISRINRVESFSRDFGEEVRELDPKFMEFSKLEAVGQV